MDLKRLATRPLRYVHDNGRIIVGRPREGRLRRWSCGLQVCHWTIGSAREQGSSQVVLGQLGPLVRAVHARRPFTRSNLRTCAGENDGTANQEVTKVNTLLGQNPLTGRALFLQQALRSRRASAVRRSGPRQRQILCVEESAILRLEAGP